MTENKECRAISDAIRALNQGKFGTCYKISVLNALNYAKYLKPHRISKKMDVLFDAQNTDEFKGDPILPDRLKQIHSTACNTYLLQTRQKEDLLRVELGKFYDQITAIYLAPMVARADMMSKGGMRLYETNKPAFDKKYGFPQKIQGSCQKDGVFLHAVLHYLGESPFFFQYFREEDVATVRDFSFRTAVLSLSLQKEKFVVEHLKRILGGVAARIRPAKIVCGTLNYANEIQGGHAVGLLLCGDNVIIIGSYGDNATLGTTKYKPKMHKDDFVTGVALFIENAPA